jgi:hypothetical protein
MLLLGVADCCRLIHRFAFTSFAALLRGGVLCFDLRAVAPSKRQTNGKISQSFIEHRVGAALIQCSKILLQIALGLPRYLPVTS